MDYSKKDYERILENFSILKKVVEGYNTETTKNFYDSNKKFIDDIIFTYKTLKELRENKYLIKSYLNNLESSLTEEDPDDLLYIDENDIKYTQLLKAYEIINDKINFHDENLNKQQNEIMNLFKFSIVKDVAQNVITTKYKHYECEFNFMRFKCTGSKSSSRWKTRNLG